MRFESVQIRRFGCLEDVEIGTRETALPSIIAILGPNESGKSTFFSFLTTLLYGFRPAKRTTNPYTPWLGEDPPEGRARLRLDDGEVQEIHRRLLSAPWGRLHTSGREESVSNKPLPCVAALGHVPRGVFQQVYALTLAELSGLEGKSWDLVQEQLVGSMGADLKPAGKIVSEFEDEAKKLWRPDNRGKPLHKTLQSKLDGLREQRRTSQKRDQDLRSKVKALVEKAAASRALAERRQQEQKRRTAIYHRLNVLLPVRKTLSRIEDLQARAEPREELEGLPADPRQYLDTLRDSRRQTKSQASVLTQEADSYRKAIQRERPNISKLEHRQNVLFPVKRELSRIENLRVRAGPNEELSGLPPDPHEYFDKLKTDHRNAKARVEELDGAAVNLRDAIASLRNTQRAVGTIERKVSAAADRLAHLRGKMKEAGRTAERSSERCVAQARDLFSVPWPQIDHSRVLAIPVAELAERVREYQETSRKRAEEEDGVPGDRARPPGLGRLGVAGLIFLVGVLVLLLGSRDALVLAIGIGAVTGSFALGAWWRAHAVRANGIRERWSDSLATLKSEEEAAWDEIRKLVGRLRIQAWLLEPPNLNFLLERVGGMVDLSNGLAEDQRVLARRRAKYDEETSTLRAMVADEIRRLGETTTVPVHENLRAQADALQGAARAIQRKIDVKRLALERAEVDLNEARDQLRNAADGLQTFKDTLASFDDGNVDGGLQEVVERLDARIQARQLQAKLEREEPDLDGLKVQIHQAETDGESWDTLKARLEAARTTRDQTTGKLENIESQLEDTEEKRNELEGKIETFMEKLGSFGEGDEDRGLTEVVKRLDARRRESQLRAELERDRPDLDEIVAQIQDAEANGETWDSLPQDLKAMDQSLQDLIDEGQEQGELIGRLKSEIHSIKREETTSQVQEEIELVEAKMLAARESRDRLFLMARLVQEADRRFRERHQPALLKKAGKYVDQITGGRYDRIVIGETGEKFFSLRDPANSRLRKMSDPFSQGIKEQVYFALRLAAIDHLDADRERLPLFLDEVFVNWDQQRLGRAFELVEHVARERQVFFFTCHEAMAARLKNHGGMIINLS